MVGASPTAPRRADGTGVPAVQGADLEARTCPRCRRALTVSEDTRRAAETLTATLMVGMLETAVPAAVEELRWRSWTEVAGAAHAAADVVASQGDILQFRGGKRGETGRGVRRPRTGACGLGLRTRWGRLLRRALVRGPPREHGRGRAVLQHREGLGHAHRH